MALPTKQSVRITKSFTYRGATKLWSNRYFLVQTIGSSHYVDVMDAIVSAEHPIIDSSITIVKGEFILVGSETPFTSKTYSQAGTLSTTSSFPTPGDAAMIARYSTDQKTSKNHPIYLFNYYHGPRWASGSTPDDLLAGQKTALETYGSSWISGITYGGGAGVVSRCGPRGAVALARFVEPYIGHRDFT